MKQGITYLCLLTIFLLPEISKSQANIYHSFRFDQHPRWRIDFHDPYDCGYDNCALCFQLEYFITGDTIINSINYYKVSHHVYNYDSVYSGAIREDTVQKKVFVLYAGLNYETVLYDFNLQVGDTIDCNNGITYGVVDTIDSVLVGTEMHRRINFIDWYNISAIVEGVGSQTGLFEPCGYGVGFEGVFSSLRCFKLNDTLQYEQYSLCSECDYALSDLTLTASENEFPFPNPFRNHFTIQNLSRTIHSIEVYNSLGKLIFRDTAPKLQYQIGDGLSHGIYFIVLHKKDSDSTMKVVKQ